MVDFLMLAAGGAGIAVGFLLSNQVLKLSSRFKGLMSAAFKNTTAQGIDWGTWGAWGLAVAVWLLIMGWGISRARKSDGILNYLLAGVGVGGLLEELTAMPATG